MWQSLGVGDAAVIQDLQQNVEHIRMGLFYLVKKNDTVGTVSYTHLDVYKRQP